MRALICVWAAWGLVIVGFQAFVRARVELGGTDHALPWTEEQSVEAFRSDKPYLADPFMNEHVAWDSESYLSIALAGYDDPMVRTVATPSGGSLSLNYARFPLYPLTIRALAWPLNLLQLSDIARATLAGVVVSLISALGAMMALYDLTAAELGHRGGLRAAIYLVLFPTGFFLAQVYSESEFIALSFASLALARRRRFALAGVMAAGAVLTRPPGILLLLPLGLALWDQRRELVTGGFSARIRCASMCALPAIAFVAWWLRFYDQFSSVQRQFFNSAPLMVSDSLHEVSLVASRIVGDNAQAAAYALVQIGTMIGTAAAIVATRRSHKDASIFGAAVLLVSLTSGSPQAIQRYALAVPSVFIVLARLGRNAGFDRAWSLCSTLLMGLLATLFSFDFWVG